jgi:plasmid maintenance system killer protein
MASHLKKPEIRRMAQQIAALRAFHTGLVSETHRHLHALRAFERHIEVLRHPHREAHSKLAAAQRSWLELRRLEQLRGPWRDTFRDFKMSLRRIHALLQQIAKHSRGEPRS